MPALSVIVPNYNHAGYLGPALRAHLEQTLSPLEVIVVDDASTDDSVGVVEGLAKRYARLRLIRLARNGGVNAAINRGLREARGEYVCFSAADDLVSADFAARSLHLLAAHPGAAFCFSDFERQVGDTGRIQPRPMYLSKGPSFLSPNDLHRILKRDWFSLPGFVVYRRAAIVGVGGFAEDLHWHADWFMNRVLGFRHGACYVPESLVVVRFLTASYSATGIQQTRVQREINRRVIDRLESVQFADVLPSFRDCALLPDCRIGALLGLMVSSRHRHYLTTRLFVKAAVHGAWSKVKPYVPDRLRPSARVLALRWAQVWTTV